MSIQTHTHYERLPNGLDLYTLRTNVRDVLVCNMAFPGGTHATYERQSIAGLLETVMPTGTHAKSRRTVREEFERLGAHVAMHAGATHFTVSLACRSTLFKEVSTLLLEVLTQPRIKAREYTEAVAQMDTELLHALDDTRVQATTTLLRALYQKGHPHWVPLPIDLRKELAHVTTSDVLMLHHRTLSALGAIVCVTGDIHRVGAHEHLRSLLAALPHARETTAQQLDIRHSTLPKERDLIVSMREKMNIDTCLAIPLALTNTHDAYHALLCGTHILGASGSSRLFLSLRGRQSLTYGAYAGLAGMADGYPGYLLASAIFPNDVFAKGRVALRNEVARWAEKGVTASELTRRKEELVGKYKVGLATTRGVAGALFGAVLERRGVAYIDDYPTIVEALTLRDVNRAIKEHVRYDLAVTAAAGSVDESGKPL